MYDYTCTYVYTPVVVPLFPPYPHHIFIVYNISYITLSYFYFGGAAPGIGNHSSKLGHVSRYKLMISSRIIHGTLVICFIAIEDGNPD